MEKEIENDKLVKCQGKCKQYLPRESFYRNRSRENGLQITCKECTKESVRNYEARKKLGAKQLTCVVEGCNQKRSKNSPDGKCGDCRHREKMRTRYHKDPTYYKIKHAAWSKRRAARNKEIEIEELELINHGVRLTKGQMFLLTRFNGTTWLIGAEVNPRNLFIEDIELLYEHGLIKSREVDGLTEYALTEKGLEFLGFEPLEIEK